jgi:hypothetical protein
MFLVKYNADGTIARAQKISQVAPRDIEIDPSGNLYVTGTASASSVDFGGAVGTISITSSSSFTAKFDSAGNALWVKAGIGANVIEGIALDNSGNCYVTGAFQGTLTLGSNPSLSSTNNSLDIFVAKYSTTGSELWSVKSGGAEDDHGYGIDVDAVGNSYVTGYFGGTATIAGFSLTGASSVSNLFVAKYNSLGTGTWATQAELYTLLNTEIRLYDTDKLLVTGEFWGTAILGGSTINTPDPSIGNAYITKLIPSTIATGSLSVSTVCAGGVVTVPYATTGVFNAGNTFRVQLSNASGSFASPVNLTTLSSTASSITARIPTNAAQGTNYRVRVVSTNPVIVGTDNGANLAVRSFTVTITTDPEQDFPGGPVSICAGGTVILSAVTSSPTPLSYTWTPLPDLSATTGSVVTFDPFDPNTYFITVTGTDGTCSKTSVAQQVDVLDGCFTAASVSSASSVSIYPNPVSEKLTVQLPASGENVQIQILDLQGNVREERRGNLDAFTIPVQSLTKGTYIVRIIQGKRVHKERIQID